MAQGGHSFGMDEEDGEDTEDFVPLPFMLPQLQLLQPQFLLGLKKEGDEKFQAQLYNEAAAVYTLAINNPFKDIVIAEKLFRKRAVCFYKMGKYPEAILDCGEAIAHADCIKNKNLLAKSVFIKMKAIVCLGDFVTAFKVALWCKHLRPNCEKTKECLNDIKEKLREAFKKDRSLVQEVLRTMIDFAEMFNMDNNTRALALEIYTELLDLFDFLLLPEILRRQAEILMNLGRYEEAKDICAKVLWLGKDDLKALEIMTKITQRLRERELKQAKETKRTNTVKREPSEMEVIGAAASSKDSQPLLSKVESARFSREEHVEIKPNDEAMMTVSEENVREHERENASHLRPVESPARFPLENSLGIKPNDDVKLNSEKKEQRSQVTEENPLAVATDDAQQKMADSDQTQSEYAAAKEDEKSERRKQKKRKKKAKKKKKKKAQQFKENSSDQAPGSNVDEEPLEESPDEGDSQATGSVLGDPDIYLGYQSDCSTTLRDRNASFTTSETALSTLGVNQDDDSDDGDFIPVQNTRRPVLSTAKASTSTSDVPRQFGERASGLDWIDAPPGLEFQSVTEVKVLPLTPEQNTSQLQVVPPSSGFRKEDNANTSEVHRSLRFGEFPNLTEGNVNRPIPNSMRMGTSGNAWVNINQSNASPLNSSSFHSEVPSGKQTTEQLSRMSSQGIHGQTSSSTSFACFTSPGQSDSSSNPVTFSQSFQTNSATRKHTLNPPPGLNGPIRIPEDVVVVCEHFLLNIIKAKTCQFCEERGKLKYAAWNRNRWQVMRPYPQFKLPPNAIFDVCKHFASGRQCLKEPCTFPHGEQEIIMWTLERQGLLASPEESLQLLRANTTAASMMIEPVVQENGTNSMPLHIAENRGVSMASFGGSTVNGFAGLEAVPSQSSTTSDSDNPSSSIWSSPFETSGGSFEPVPSLQQPVVKTSQEEAFLSHRSTADSSEHTKSSVRSSVLNQSERTFAPVPPMAKPTITTSHVGRREAGSSSSSHADSSKVAISSARYFVPNQSERTFTTSHAGHTEAVSSKSSTEVSSDSVAKKSAKPSTLAASALAERPVMTSASLESSGRPSTPVVSSTTPANVPCQSSTTDSTTNASSSAQSTSFKLYARPSSPLPPSGKPATMSSPAEPITKTGSVPSSNSYNDFRKIPKGVYVVCDDFLWKNQKRPASIYEKTKACKGCENRSRLKYAVWSDNSKQWQLIRPYPGEKVSTKVAFKECAHNASNKPCLKNPCSFAHGQLELIMWTMEREGGNLIKGRLERMRFVELRVAKLVGKIGESTRSHKRKLLLQSDSSLLL